MRMVSPASAWLPLPPPPLLLGVALPPGCSAPAAPPAPEEVAAGAVRLLLP
jgi:hypothetical protein